jgi:hypothetical protein
MSDVRESFAATLLLIEAGEIADRRASERQENEDASRAPQPGALCQRIRRLNVALFGALVTVVCANRLAKQAPGAWHFAKLLITQEE